eukprot:TRINITY_DN6402_c0_g2_i3.p3 TRINITY_DN6402_c0_g2~~TRINITY_DN6402_c0_g2_i3.p3  ORF type:complete len:140 (+),score=22.35 TRINITY_DN6402_c0_g2_i3:55-420(+)
MPMGSKMREISRIYKKARKEGGPKKIKQNDQERETKIPKQGKTGGQTIEIGQEGAKASRGKAERGQEEGDEGRQSERKIWKGKREMKKFVFHYFIYLIHFVFIMRTSIYCFVVRYGLVVIN